MSAAHSADGGRAGVHRAFEDEHEHAVGAGVRRQQQRAATRAGATARRAGATR